MSILDQAISTFMRLPNDLRERGQELMFALEAPAQALDAFIDEANKEIAQRRAEEHHEAVLACRAQETVIEGLELKLDRAKDRAWKDEHDLTAAFHAVRAANSTPLGRWPLPEEIAAHQEAVEIYTRAYEKAESKMRSSTGVPHSLQEDIRQARAKLQELADVEFALRPKQESAPARALPNGWDRSIVGTTPQSEYVAANPGSEYVSANPGNPYGLVG